MFCALLPSPSADPPPERPLVTPIVAGNNSGQVNISMGEIVDALHVQPVLRGGSKEVIEAQGRKRPGRADV